MATPEQMLEALQQIQVLTTRMAALETQLQFESARAQQAEQESEHVDPESGSDANEPRRRHGRYEGDRSALHSERRCRP